MPQLELAAGLTITHPDAVEASPGAPAPARAPRGGTRRSRGAAPSTELELDPLIAALQREGMELVGQFQLTPRPERRPRGGTRQPRAGLPGAAQPSTVSLDLGSNEDAVILTVDTNDEVDWVLPSGESLTGPTRAPRGARGDRGAREGGRRVTFEIATAEPVRRPRDGARRARGPVLGAILKGVAGFVFKFVRAGVTKKLIDHLEKSVAPGLVRVSTNVSADWSRLGPEGVLPAVPPRAADGVPRVLLLVHGTFSSTVSSFGALSFSDEGLALLNGVQEKYDHVIGWDHRTLSEEPLPNARQIFDGLERLFGPGGAVIDAVGFSRGGLVLRTLLEQVVPGTPWEGRFSQAVFVGCTLNGTKLAQEKNWKAFVKIYTNLAIAACRGVRTLLPPAAVATVWVETIARGISALVRFLATAVLDKGGIPGLTAMDPDKEIVQQLNAADPDPALAARYRVVTNDFEPGLPGPDGDVLPASFKVRAADLIMDAQMREPNDLVVNTSSMLHVGQGTLPDAQVFALARNGRTIHTTYFRDPDVIAQLRAWLLGEAVSRAPRGRRSAAPTRASRSARRAAPKRKPARRVTAKRAATPRGGRKRTAAAGKGRTRAARAAAARSPRARATKRRTRR